MTETARALQTFFSGFGLPAYVEGHIPDSQNGPPYITYELRRPETLGQTGIFARVWYRDSSLVGITSTVDAIKRSVAGGVSLQVGNGALRIWPDEIFAQFMDDDDPDIKVAYLRFILESDYA